MFQTSVEMTQRKTALVIRVTLLSIVMLTLIFNTQPVKSEPRTWTVDDDGPADFHTIQEAINAASEGDFIYVSSGIYYEHLVVNKPLTLAGESNGNTVIDGNRENQTLVKVTANNVVISGFTIQNSGSQPGIKIFGYTNLTDNYIKRNKIGVYVSFKSSIVKNIVTNNGQGISLDYCSEVLVEANNLSANTFGISLAKSFNNIIRGNSVTKSSPGGHGITVLSGSYNNTVSGNIVINNSHGIWLSGSYNNWIVENIIAKNDILGIELTDSPNNTIYHNSFINNKKQVGGVVTRQNTWDDGYPSGGNYWNDYIDVDEKSGSNQDQPGSDGIWDKPYVINENNQDRYPFVKTYGELPDPVKDETKPTANAGSDRTVNVGTPVTFDASESTDNFGIISYEWDFGDETTKTGMIATHIYTEPGSYAVTLTVKDAAGNSDIDSITVKVVAPSPQDSLARSIWPVPAIILMTAVALVLFHRHRKRRYRRHEKKIRIKVSTEQLLFDNIK